MVKVIEQYKGVILLFLTLVLVGMMGNGRIKELNNQSNTNQVTYYEK